MNVDNSTQKTDSFTTATDATGTMSPKSVFNRIGFALFAVASSTILLQAALWMYRRRVITNTSSVLGGSGFMWIATFAPLYIVGVALFLLVVKRIPPSRKDTIPLGGKNFLLFLLMCFPLLYGGSLLGNLLSLLLSLGATENPLFTYAFDDSPLRILVLVVLAPLVEEFLFRKQIIDRCSRYGEKITMVFSALTFALFHMNLYQFFYAFGLGLVLAYVYLRTGRLRYSVAMHMIVNFIGSVLGPYLLSKGGLDAIVELESGLWLYSEAMLRDMLPKLVGVIIYALVWIVLSIVGLILLIKKTPKLLFLPAEEEIPNKLSFKTVYCNTGMVLFTLFCVLICVLNII